MRDYSKITPRFWIGKTGRALRGDPEATVVALYLCTGPHANMIGLYYLPIAYITGDTGIPYEGVAKALDKLTTLGFCSYDPDAELVWVINMLKVQVAELLKPGDNNAVAVAKAYEALPESRLLSIFYGKYSQSHSLPLHRGSNSPLPRAFISQEQEQEQEQEQKQEQKQETLSPLALVPATPKPCDVVFNHWRSVTGHNKAILDPKRTKLINAAMKLGYTVEQLKQAIDGNKASAFHQGDNDHKTVYDGLDLILRDAAQIDKFIALADGRGTSQYKGSFQELDDHVTAQLERLGYTEKVVQ